MLHNIWYHLRFCVQLDTLVCNHVMVCAQRMLMHRYPRCTRHCYESSVYKLRPLTVRLHIQLRWCVSSKEELRPLIGRTLASIRLHIWSVGRSTCLWWVVSRECIITLLDRLHAKMKDLHTKSYYQHACDWLGCYRMRLILVSFYSEELLVCIEFMSM